jgi:hypothetical protein
VLFLTAQLSNSEERENSFSEWDGEGFASGIYYYRLEAGTFSGVKKLVLMK